MPSALAPEVPKKDLINLQLGWPSPSLFPSEALARAANATLLDKDNAAATLVYGPDPGNPSLREAVASWLTRFYQPKAGPVGAERIFASHGASGALNMLLTMFTDPAYTRNIWMVEPTYFLACPSFLDAGFTSRLRGVPEDEEGVDIEYLREHISKSEQNGASDSSQVDKRRLKLYRHVIYAVPTFSNPSAKTMSLRRRKQLIQIAREFDALIITDDVYDFLQWPAEEGVPVDTILPAPEPRLVDLDREMKGGQPWGNAVSNGSFSKIVAPGVRVGWIEGSSLVAEALCKVGSVASGGSQCHFSSMVINQLIRSGDLDKHIRGTLIPTYQKRSRVMIRSINKHICPLGWAISSSSPESSGVSEHTNGNSKDEAAVNGGFFIYLQAPESSPPVDQIAKYALEEYNLRVAHGRMMTVAGDLECLQRAETPRGFGQGLRLCWAWHEENEIEEGIVRLASAIKAVTNVS